MPEAIQQIKTIIYDYQSEKKTTNIQIRRNKDSFILLKVWNDILGKDTWFFKEHKTMGYVSFIILNHSPSNFPVDEIEFWMV